MNKLVRFEKKISYIFFLFIIFTFILGFFFQENSSGGKIDEIHIIKNISLVNTNSFSEIDWTKFESTSLPLFYFIYKFFFNNVDIADVRLFNFIISSVSFLFILKSLLKLFKEYHKYLICLLSSCLLLSPYFRTSSYNAMEENSALLFFSIGIYIFTHFQRTLTSNLLILLFLSLSTYCRTNYIVLYIVFFFLLINKENLIKKDNLLLFIFSIFFFIPAIYIFFLWGGLVSPHTSFRTEFFFSFNKSNIVSSLNIILIYTLPFFLFNFIKNLNKIFSLKWFFLIIGILYFILFYDYLPNQYAGGAINKLSHILFNNLVLKFFLLFVSFLSIVIFLTLFRQNLILSFFVILNFIVFSQLDFVFQEYYDPIFFLMTIFFIKDFFSQKHFFRQVYFILGYFIFFYISSFSYQYFIININFNKLF